jgi:hypothetical protein
VTTEMSQYGSLSKEEQARVDRKLTELQKNTGESWSCEVTQLPQGENQNPLLEIAIDGRITKPILLGDEDIDPADRICSELETFARQRRP